VRKNLLRFGLGLAVPVLLALIIRSLFEVVPAVKYLEPSREARINEYLALDRWLAVTGHPVRIGDSGDLASLKAAPEGTVVIQSALFDWTGEAAEYLRSWIEKGGSLVLCLDYSWEWDEDRIQGKFLAGLGFGQGERPDGMEYYYDPAEPAYESNIIIDPPAEGEPLILTDYNGLVRVARRSLGRGRIAVSGKPRFMTSQALREEQNARLAWYLLAGDPPEPEGVFNPGIFFIRGREKVQGLVGRLFRQGNFTVLIISGLVFLFVGFWSVIPGFGVARGDDVYPGRPLRERFLAEGRFLKRWGALDSFRAAYLREIARRLKKREGPNSEEEILRRALEIWEKAAGQRDLAAARTALSPGRLKDRAFTKSIIILKTIVEGL
jgi:hypothetical protein